MTRDATDLVPVTLTWAERHEFPGRRFVWVAARRVHRTHLDENAHEDDEPDAHQQHCPPVLLKWGTRHTSGSVGIGNVERYSYGAGWTGN